MSSLVTVATCNLNQWALDFTGNVDRILESCKLAKEHGARYRLGPELEICGYGCEDHFYEADTIQHCWEGLAKLFRDGATDGLLCDFGMPILRYGIRFNCRVLCLDRRVLLIRPKLAMADDGNYRESRYFTAYQHLSNKETALLPLEFQQEFGQDEAPFGIHYITFQDGISVGCESCEELWTPRGAHIDAAQCGVEIIGNASGSHHELRKLNQRLELMVSATRKCGGIYLYSNQRGCDGGRLYYDGCAMIVCNGQVLAQANQFDVNDVQVVTATIDVNDVRSYRASIPSFGVQAAASQVDLKSVFLTSSETISLEDSSRAVPTVPQPSLRIHLPEEECALGPACWLWDYLRRSGAAGFLLPLSGGADSSSVAAIAGAMCHMVTNAAQDDPAGKVAQDCRRICGKKETDWIPETSQEMAGYLLHTLYMGTDNSSDATRSRAKRLASAIGSYHLAFNVDAMVAAVLKVFTLVTSKTPRFTSRGGTMTEDLALQNIQARLRMVTAYLFAQLLPWVRDSSGFLLVLGSANVDEGLRGYMTKYDCSSADLNPIGAISKLDLKRLLFWASKKYPGYGVLAEVAGAPPTAELRPISGSGESGEEHSQLDEEEMGMTYKELGYFGKLRKISRCGPVSMFQKLCVAWKHLSPTIVAQKVKRFFHYYSINRHKMCTITPAYHAEAYSPDDNRFDLRQFLYPRWTWQFAAIDRLVQKHGASEKASDKNE